MWVWTWMVQPLTDGGTSISGHSGVGPDALSATQDALDHASFTLRLQHASYPGRYQAPTLIKVCPYEDREAHRPKP